MTAPVSGPEADYKFRAAGLAAVIPHVDEATRLLRLETGSNDTVVLVYQHEEGSDRLRVCGGLRLKVLGIVEEISPGATTVIARLKESLPVGKTHVIIYHGTEIYAFEHTLKTASAGVLN